MFSTCIYFLSIGVVCFIEIYFSIVKCPLYLRVCGGYYVKLYHTYHILNDANVLCDICDLCKYIGFINQINAHTHSEAAVWCFLFFRSLSMLKLFLDYMRIEWSKSEIEFQTLLSFFWPNLFRNINKCEWMDL